MATKNKIKDLLISLCSMPNAPAVSEVIPLVEQYHAVLGHWPDEVLEMAVLQYRSFETFFPTPGVLNSKVMDLQMITMGIPTAAEAWGQVLDALQMVPTVVCEEADRLRKSAESMIGGNYLFAVQAYAMHADKCQICTPGGYKEIYGHPVVAETVRLLGGRENLMTENQAADRKQFVDAYRERVQIELKKYAMPPAIKEFIGREREKLLEAPIQNLTRKLEMKNDN